MTTTDNGVGELVAAARAARNLSRVKFGELVGMTGTQISNIEKGRKLKDGELERLSPFLHGDEQLPIQDPGGDGAVPGAAEPGSLADGAAAVPVASPPVVATDAAYSNSELQTFKRCKRKWYLAFYRKVGLKERAAYGAASLGTRVHAALAGWYRPVGEQLNPYELLNAGLQYDLQQYPDQQHEIMQEGELARVMIEGYFQWLAETGADSQLEIIGEEQVVQVDITLPDGRVVSIRGRLDVRARRITDGVTLFLDHKTVGNLAEPVRTLHMDEQMLMYHLLEYLSLLGNPEAPRTDGGLYGMLRKVKRTASAKPPFYERVEVRHNPSELANFYARVVGTITDILDVQGKLDAGHSHMVVAYPRPAKDCTWSCEFFPVCPMFDDGSNAEGMLERLYQPVNPYERYVNDKVGENE